MEKEEVRFKRNLINKVIIAGKKVPWLYKYIVIRMQVGPCQGT